MAAPSDISGLVAWYRASDADTLFSAGSTAATDGGVVGKWSDKSGNGWDLTQATAGNKPTYLAGLYGGVLKFNGDHWLLNEDFVLEQPNTVFIRFFVPQGRYQPDSNPWVYPAVVYGGDPAANRQEVYLSANDGNSDDSQLLRLYSTSASDPTSVKTALPHLGVAIFNGASSKFRLDGVEQVVDSIGTDAKEQLSIGANADGTSPAFVLVAEVFVFNRALSADELADMEAYAYTDALSSAGKDLIVFDGDSITRGSYVSLFEDYPFQTALELDREDLIFYNRGIPSQTIAGAISTDTDVDAYYSEDSRANICVFFAGTNDFALEGATLATVKTRTQTYCEDRQNAGWKVFVATMLPRGASMESNRLDFNVWLRANYTTFADGIIDFAADSRIGDAADYLDLTYYRSDAVHPNAAGAAVMASIAAEAIEAFLVTEPLAATSSSTSAVFGQQFLGELEQIFTGAQGGYVNRWSAANFFDKVLFANASVSPQYWAGTFPYQAGSEMLGLARPIPGLPRSVGYDGVEIVAGHPVLWQGATIKWADIHDFTMWLPVGVTAVSLVAETQTAFEHPAAGFDTNWIHLDEDASAFVAGQYVRVEVNPEDPTRAQYLFYEVAEVADPTGVGAASINVTQSVPAGSEGTRIFTKTYTAWGEGSRVNIGGRSTTLEVVEVSRDLAGTFTSNLISEYVPAVGETFRIRVAENPSSLQVGDVLSLGQVAATGLDLYEVTQVAFYLELRRLGIGTDRAATNYRYPSGSYLTFQPFVGLSNPTVAARQILKSTPLTAQLAVKLTGLGLTGEPEDGDSIPANVSISSVDANEAGEAINAGSQINGNIFAIVSLGEYGVILKERSIQSMQFVGRASGTFYFRPEILDEGPVSKNAWTRMGDKQIAFLGHKELYAYAGGQTLTPVAQQHTKEVLKEMDRSRADEVVLYHNEKEQELWLVYPTLEDDELKVMIFSYKFNSVVIDYYDKAIIGRISALGGVAWEVAPTWRSLADTLYWKDETRKWYSLVEDGLQTYTLIGVTAAPADPSIGEVAGTTVPRVLLHGRKFSRTAGDNCLETAYTALAETSDFEFGDSAAWKYCDSVVVDLEVKQHLERPAHLYVQLGAKNTLDSDIRWGTPSKLEVSGNGLVHSKVNLRMAGRFLRVRFYSQDIGVEWRVAGFRLIGRKGGTY